ncbi:HEAT repeat domain containing protein [Acanthamoeba castellanii str. Neff]|uniref:HEAT repeat domain containing protein n=1 Tax=Acanthamoeba castellanii (strain ATCC 30010 / Neff) TaxID=1257118 RepID=L8H2E4_ACACF|nr:HEAT repeat domain containing protein [Acanthamoeba castellanii str. Neff]ELR19410.1 HEAT repeat domain containing protein [Acanthamoeba castellanii str. Neff]
MDVDNNKHGREGQDTGDATGDASHKKIKLGDLEKELRDWTLFELFDGLTKLSAQEDEDDLLEIVREIRKRLAGPSGLHILLSDQVKPFLTGGLTAALPAVRELTLAQLARTASAGPQGFALLTEVWPAIVKSVADSNLRVATIAVQTILTVAKEAVGQELVFSSTSSSMFNGMIIESEVLRLRVLDLFVELSLQSAELLERSKDYLGLMSRELDSKDLLQRMNVLELLEKLAKTEHGVAYVQSSGAMASILHLLTDTEDPGFSLLCGSALRLLASIARQQGIGGDLQSFVPVLKVVEQLLESRDESCAEAAISFVGALGSTVAGAELLLSRRALVKSWFEHLTATAMLLRLSCLHALAELLTCPDHEKTLEIFNVEDKGWDGSSSGEVMRTFMKFLDQPFPDLRHATFHAVQALARHPWGVKALFAYPGFLEFIVNRGTETTKEGKEWKYAIVESIVMGEKQYDNRARETLGEAAFNQLVTYLTEGVHYVQGELATKIASKSA